MKNQRRTIDPQVRPDCVGFRQATSLTSKQLNFKTIVKRRSLDWLQNFNHCMNWAVTAAILNNALVEQICLQKQA